MTYNFTKNSRIMMELLYSYIIIIDNKRGKDIKRKKIRR